MTMEERDQWEEMAQRNKRRRLNNYSTSDLKDVDTNEANINNELSSDDDSSSASTSFEAISFENIEQLSNPNGDNQDLSVISSDDDKDNENDGNSKIKTEQNQIENLVRIPKKMQHQRSHLDLIKAVRKSYLISKELPVLEDFIEQQGITRKRAKRAILQVMREHNLDVTKLRKRETKPGDDDEDDGADEEEDEDLKSPTQISGDGAQRKLKRFKDSSDEDDSDEDEDMTEKAQKREMKLRNLPKNAGKYPFDSAVEKAMLRLLNRLKQLSIF